jgi:hypothetical protein
MKVLETESVCCAIRNETLDAVHVNFYLKRVISQSVLEATSFVFSFVGRHCNSRFYWHWKVEGAVALIYRSRSSGIKTGYQGKYEFAIYTEWDVSNSHCVALCRMCSFYTSWWFAMNVTQEVSVTWFEMIFRHSIVAPDKSRININR